MRKKLISLLMTPFFVFGLNSCKQEPRESEKKERIIFTDNKNIKYDMWDYGEDGTIDLVNLKKVPSAQHVIYNSLYAPGYENEVPKTSHSSQEMSPYDQQLFNKISFYLKQLEERDF